MVTAKDIANELGIAVSTVGRAMADDPRISARTKAKVRKVADRLGYVGNMPARIMRGESSRLMGLMIPDVSNDFYASVAQSLSEVMDERGYRLVLLLTRDDPAIEERQVAEIVGARAAGVIIVPTARPTQRTRSLLLSLRSVQFLRRVPGLGSTWIGIDDERAIASAAAYFIERGHRRIAYLGGREDMSTGTLRARGFRRALAHAGIAADDAPEYLGDLSDAFGQDATRSLLQLAQWPTAVVTGSVHIMLGMIRELDRQQVRVPDDISVMGFGEAQWFEWWRGGISALRLPVRNLAHSCGLWIAGEIQSPDETTADGYSIMWPCKIIERNSIRSIQTSALPAADVSEALETPPPRRIAPHRRQKSESID